MADFPFFAKIAKKSLIKIANPYFFLTDSKRRDFEDSKTPGLFEKWAILADLMTIVSEQFFFIANFRHNPWENLKLRL